MDRKPLPVVHVMARVLQLFATLFLFPLAVL